MAKAKAKKEVNTALVAKAESAIEIAKEIQDATNQLLEAGGECDDKTLAALNDLKMDFHTKAESIAHVDTRLEHDAEYYRAIVAAAKGRLNAIEATQKRLKGYLTGCMKLSGETTIKGTLFTISLSKGRASVQITNEGKLPYEFVSVVELIKPKTAEIKEALERGEEVPGSTLVFGESYITIRKAGKKENNDNG